MTGDSEHLAVLIGIADYVAPQLRLTSPTIDVGTLKQVLEERHGYEAISICDREATKERLSHLFETELPTLARGRRLLVYFAGHGTALDTLAGIRGYLVPADWSDHSSLLSMDDLSRSLDKLECKHLMLVLDCCFAGAFRWSALRDLVPVEAPTMYLERYQRYLDHPAWQVLTSAAHDERAADVLLDGITLCNRPSSPFLDKLLDGLAGAADLAGATAQPDGVITATELYLYLRDQLATTTQTPGLWPLRHHGKGEFIFHVPGKQPQLVPAIELNDETCPYRGFETYEEKHEHLLFGRTHELRSLAAHVESQSLSLVVGRSGVGKSSLVRAGLVPALKARGYHVIAPFRPGRAPIVALDAALATGHGNTRNVLVVDQLDELYTQNLNPEVRLEFFRVLDHLRARDFKIVCTMRIDLEPQLWTGPLKDRWAAARFPIAEMTQDQLRAVIERPADERMLEFDPPDLVDQLVNAVVAMPGGLPLLSFTLRELYLAMLSRGATDRKLTSKDYDKIGGVEGALQRRLDDLYDGLRETLQRKLQNVLLRMVTVRGGEYARRQVPIWELDESTDADAEVVLRRLREARLVVDGGEASDKYVEPAHDAVVRGWSRLKQWLSQPRALEDLVLHRELAQAAGPPATKQPLWTRDPRRIMARERLAADRLNQRERKFLDESDRARRRVLFGAAVIGAVLVGAASFAAYQSHASSLAQANEQLAEALRLHDLGVGALSQRDMAGAEAFLVASLKIRDAFDTRTRILEARASAPSGYWADRPGGGIVALSPATGTVAYVRPEQGELRVGLWDARRRKELKTFPHLGKRAAAFSPDGRRFAFAGLHGDVWWQKLDGASLDHLSGIREDGEPVHKMVFDATGELLVVGREDHTVTVYNLVDGARNEFAETDSIVGVAISPDGSVVAAGGSSFTFTIWDRQTGKALGRGSHQDTVESIAFDPAGTKLATGGADGIVNLWVVPKLGASTSDIPRMVPAQSITVGSSVNDLAYDPRRPRIAFGTEDGMVRIWDLDASQFVLALRGDGDATARVAFAKDGTRVYAGGLERSFHIWDLRERGGRTVYRSPKGLEEGGEGYGAFTADSKALITGSKGSGAIRFWPIDPIGEGRLIRTAPNPVYGLAINADGWVATTGDKVNGDDKLPTVSLFRISEDPALRLIRHLGETDAVAFDRDGHKLLTGGRDYKIRIWDVATGVQQAEIELTGSGWNAAFDPIDASVIATGDGDKRTSVWRVADSPQLLFQCVETGEVWGLAFSPDGRFLASGGVSRRVHVWRISGFTENRGCDGAHLVRTFENHVGTITTIAFAPDSNRLASGGMDTLVYLARVSDGQNVPLRDHTLAVWWVAISPDGRFLASGGLDGRIVVWRISEIDRIVWDATPVVLSAEVQESTGLQLLESGKLEMCASCGNLEW